MSLLGGSVQHQKQYVILTEWRTSATTEDRVYPERRRRAQSDIL